MAQCTAPDEGHQSMETARDCPKCGPGVRTIAGAERRVERMLAPQSVTQWPAQVNRKRRGHNFYPPKSANLPPLRANEEVPIADARIAARYYIGNSEWWVTEADPSTGEAYGYVCLNGDSDNAVWGYFSLPELETIHASMFSIVERDMYWRPRTVAQADLPGWHAQH